MFNLIHHQENANKNHGNSLYLSKWLKVKRLIMPSFARMQSDGNSQTLLVGVGSLESLWKLFGIIH